MWAMMVDVVDNGDTDMTLEKCVCFVSVLYIVWEEVVQREFIVKIFCLLNDANMVLTESKHFSPFVQTPSTAVMSLVILTLKPLDSLHASHVSDSVNSWHPVILFVPQKMHDSGKS